MGIFQQQKHNNKRQTEANIGSVHLSTAQRGEKLVEWILIYGSPGKMLPVIENYVFMLFFGWDLLLNITQGSLSILLRCSLNKFSL